MDAEKKLLTIAIPTYNRSHFLNQLLTALLPQLHNESRVELIVSNNNSTDNTKEVIASFQDLGMPLKANHNEVNIGGDANIHRCFDLANGKYVWIIGDDDVITPDALATVLRLISNDEYDIVYLKSVSYETQYIAEPSRNFRAPRLYTNGLSFARKVNIWFTFISGNIVNKDRATELAEQPFADYVDTTVVQLSWVFTLLANFRRGLYVETPLVAAKADNSGNYAACKVFGVTVKHVAETLLPDRRMSQAIVNKSIKHMLPHILMTLRFKNHAFEQEDPEKTLRPAIGGNILFWIFCYPLIRFPPPVARVWYLGLRVWLKAENVFLR